MTVIGMRLPHLAEHVATRDEWVSMGPNARLNVSQLERVRRARLHRDLDGEQLFVVRSVLRTRPEAA
jgi:hypothetical protein